MLHAKFQNLGHVTLTVYRNVHSLVLNGQAVSEKKMFEYYGQYLNIIIR